MDHSNSAFSPGSLAARLALSLPRAHSARRQFARGEAVFRQGDPAAAIFLVETGRIRLVRTLQDGASITLHIADAGDSFAEASLSTASYHCDAVAEMDSMVVSLPKAGILSVLASDPGESLALIGALAAQVRDLRAMLELRNIRSASDRVLAWLRLRAAGQPPIIPIRRSWTLIADEVGLTREAVYRALASLERQGQISRHGDSVRLLAPPE
jgi:CRP-like cAMP-binding protein